MVYAFDFATEEALVELEKEGGGERIALEGLKEGRCIYVHVTAFMKLLGSTVKYDSMKGELSFWDKEGNVHDPNH